MVSTQLPWIVLSTHNLEPSRSTLLLFKFFKFHLLQVWTRFAKFGEIHISPSPKILPKFRQPPGAMRGHPTKIQIKESSPHAKIILSNTWPALFLRTFREIQKSIEIQCRFHRQSSVTHRQCAWRVVHGSSSLCGAPHAHLARSWRRWHPGLPAPASSAAAEPLVAAEQSLLRPVTPFCAAL